LSHRSTLSGGTRSILFNTKLPNCFEINKTQNTIDLHNLLLGRLRQNASLNVFTATAERIARIEHLEDDVGGIDELLELLEVRLSRWIFSRKNTTRLV
jgi:hypothetical protein